jgi:hypothetical protein
VANQQKDNSGALFKNDKKTTDAHPNARARTTGSARPLRARYASPTTRARAPLFITCARAHVFALLS